MAWMSKKQLEYLFCFMNHCGFHNNNQWVLICLSPPHSRWLLFTSSTHIILLVISINLKLEDTGNTGILTLNVVLLHGWGFIEKVVLNGIKSQLQALKNNLIALVPPAPINLFFKLKYNLLIFCHSYLPAAPVWWQSFFFFLLLACLIVDRVISLYAVQKDYGR